MVNDLDRLFMIFIALIVIIFVNFRMNELEEKLITEIQKVYHGK